MTALIISGDALFKRMLGIELKQRGVEAESASDFQSAVEKRPTVIFLDAQTIKKAPKAPDGCDVVIFGRGEDISALGEGAYDYPVYERPFVVSDMLDATVGKPTPAADGVKTERSASDGLRLHTSTHSATYRGERIALSKKEYALLGLLIEKKGAALSRGEAAEKIFGGESSNVVDVYIKYLRKKIDERFGVKIITSVRGVGYEIK